MILVMRFIVGELAKLVSRCFVCTALITLCFATAIPALAASSNQTQSNRPTVAQKKVQEPAKQKKTKEQIEDERMLARVRLAIETISGKLGKSKNARDRALGLYVMAQYVREYGDPSASEQFDQSKCIMTTDEWIESQRKADAEGLEDTRESCKSYWEQLARRQAEKYVEPLAMLGASSFDPAIYDAARRACWMIDVAACDRLSTKRLTELDSENSYAWMVHAAELSWAEGMADHDLSARQKEHQLPLRVKESLKKAKIQAKEVLRGSPGGFQIATVKALALPFHDVRELPLRHFYKLAAAQLPNASWRDELYEILLRMKTDESASWGLDRHFCGTRENDQVFDKMACERWIRFKIRNGYHILNLKIDDALLTGELKRDVEKKRADEESMFLKRREL